MSLKDWDRLVDSNNEEAPLSRRRVLASTGAGVASALVTTQPTADTLADVPPREVGAVLSGHGERSKCVHLAMLPEAGPGRRNVDPSNAINSKTPLGKLVGTITLTDLHYERTLFEIGGTYERPTRTTTTSNNNRCRQPRTERRVLLTVGPGGPNLLQDRYLNEKLAHFVRERIPDRVYHVKGGGAFGYFEVTADVTQWTKAAFLNKVGKREDRQHERPPAAGAPGLGPVTVT